jgi:hypothetical protein
MEDDVNDAVFKVMPVDRLRRELLQKSHVKTNNNISHYCH